jgi:hypothetical protein
MNIYRLTENGKEVASGFPSEIKKELGITTNAFYNYATNGVKINGRYKVEIIGRTKPKPKKKPVKKRPAPQFVRTKPTKEYYVSNGIPMILTHNYKGELIHTHFLPKNKKIFFITLH